MSDKKSAVLGILGGLGPLSSAYFYEMITLHTYAMKDQDHIDIVLSSRSTTPDRTDFILGRSNEDPSPLMIEEIEKLVSYGADYIAIPCNTAHYFYDKLIEKSNVPILNMVSDTVEYCVNSGAKKIGILATKGTVGAGIYDKVCKEKGVECYIPSKECQDAVTRVIYDQIKTGRTASADDFKIMETELKNEGCDLAILGCTELSVAKKQLGLDSWYLDALEVLAAKAIVVCGKQPIGFDNLKLF